MNFLKKYAGVSVFTVVLALGAALVQAGTWNPAPPNPPSGNVDAPINVSSDTQTKMGNLILNAATSPYVNGLIAYGQTVLQANPGASSAVKIVDGKQSAGSILVSDGNGNASWGSVFGGTSFTARRSASQTGDAIAWCPTDHPYVVSCNTVGGNTANSGMYGAPSTIPTPWTYLGCTSDGPCDQTGLRTNLGTDEQYKELVGKPNGGVWGCLVYDAGHSHNSYKIDLICSK